MVASYRSPKTRVRASPIHGRGLFATRRIRRGEIVAVKGGHILDRRALARSPARAAASYIQIEDDLYIGAVTRGEVRPNKLFINHSCEPNVGIRGQITFVALRDVAAGEELTYDWAMEENWRARTRCTCQSPSCRGILTGRDWEIPVLQRRYRGFFSAYLAAKIAGASPARPRAPSGARGMLARSRGNSR
jgi:SET domain-containing protein